MVRLINIISLYLAWLILPIASVVLCGFMLVSKNKKCIWLAIPTSLAMYFLPGIIYMQLNWIIDGWLALCIIGMFFALPALFLELLIAVHVRKRFEQKSLFLMYVGMLVTSAISMLAVDPVYCIIAYSLWHVWFLPIMLAVKCDLKTKLAYYSFLAGG